MTLDHLIDRLSSAEAGSRELDCEIAVASGQFFIDGEKYGKPAYCYYDAEGRMVRPGQSGDMMVPLYTTSLDAALALIAQKLPGVWHEIDGPRKYLHIPAPSPNYWRAKLEVWGKSVNEAGGVGWGSTPALALCLALLRSLQEQSK